jgi:hypothetical protein
MQIRLTPTPVSTAVAAPTPVQSTPIPQIQPTAALPCTAAWCIVPGHFYLSLPIAPPNKTIPESSYLFGSDEDGTRPPHHGVEFVNPGGTPILAAGDGTVEYAGMDHRVIFAEQPDIYGNLVIIRHKITLNGEALFSLYGHMSKILVSTGDVVKQGQKIGEVGKTGAALGDHLHFEVRVGQNDYAHSTNPLLWLPLNQNSTGQVDGIIVGTITDMEGRLRYFPNIRILPQDQPPSSASPVYNPRSYADSSIPGDPVWNEVFIQTDLPAGSYSVTLTHHNKPQTIQVQVRAGLVTTVHFTTED